MTRDRLFSLGRVVGTRGALEQLTAEEITHLLGRHALGDWGDLVDEDRAANQRALRDGERLFSAYDLPGDRRVWIITEADRSATTVLLPEEY